MAIIVFTTRLSEADWDDALRGWRCPPLAVPGAVVEALYIDGNRVDSARYEVLREQAVIRWTPVDQPRHAAASIKLTEELTLGTDTDRWKKLAIILPVIATIAGAAISGFATYISRPNHDGDASSAKSPASPAVPRQDTQNANDNTHIRRAKEIGLGQTITLVATEEPRWFKFAVPDTRTANVRVMIRNVNLRGSI